MESSASMPLELEVLAVSTLLVLSIVVSVLVMTCRTYSTSKKSYRRLGEDVEPGSRAGVLSVLFPVKLKPSASSARLLKGLPKVLTVQVDGTELSLDYTAKHTIAWEAPLGELPAGECCVYVYPMVKTVGSAAAVSVGGAQLAALRSALIALVPESSDAASDPMLVADASGARLVHGLLIANNDEALSLAYDMFAARPALLPLPHLEGPFVGENALHVLAVNRRHEMLRRLLELAAAHLDDAALSQLLHSQAAGAFFRAEPMRYYGGSPVGYLCAFGCKRALEYALGEPRVRALIDLQGHACPISGYLPIHAAVANGRVAMYRLLVAHGADPRAKTRQPPAAAAADASSGTAELEVTPLQLACRLGDQRTVERILDTRKQVEWKWGPVTSFQLPLDEIDSSGQPGNDLLELITRADAGKTTKAMLLDDFMGGIMWKLFRQKWERFARRQHQVFRLVDLVSLSLLLSLGLALKEAPLRADRLLHPLLGAVACAGMMLYEVQKALLWYRDKGTLPGGGQPRKIGMHALSVLACASVLVRTTPPAADGAGDEVSWALLSLAIYLEFSHFISVIFVAMDQRYGIFALVVERLLATDVQVFLTFFFLYLMCFWAALYLNYPRAGVGYLSVVPQFNSMRDSFEAMVGLGTAGIRFDRAPRACTHMCIPHGYGTCMARTGRPRHRGHPLRHRLLVAGGGRARGRRPAPLPQAGQPDPLHLLLLLLHAHCRHHPPADLHGDAHHDLQQCPGALHGGGSAAAGPRAGLTLWPTSPG